MQDKSITELRQPNPYPVRLYKNIYRSNAGQLVTYQNVHDTLEGAKTNFVKQSNGDVPLYILEINGLAHV